ncbi:hypothetical protein LSTR_LSTR015341 [Laodelphax striatellus]|uniref:Uncharacterized protein n=1 Tax=Laodelphax striatellus TaxID=195883 RepID=A0A482WVI8_LAOST|nr:hypothetical protein LSTR_LSTR015341 [Laodelphax striatellus]
MVYPIIPSTGWRVAAERLAACEDKRTASRPRRQAVEGGSSARSSRAQPKAAECGRTENGLCVVGVTAALTPQLPRPECDPNSSRALVAARNTRAILTVLLLLVTIVVVIRDHICQCAIFPDEEPPLGQSPVVCELQRLATMPEDRNTC